MFKLLNNREKYIHAEIKTIIYIGTSLLVTKCPGCGKETVEIRTHDLIPNRPPLNLRFPTPPRLTLPPQLGQGLKFYLTFCF